jgi:WD40 repeat protein
MMFQRIVQFGLFAVTLALAGRRCDGQAARDPVAAQAGAADPNVLVFEAEFNQRALASSDEPTLQSELEGVVTKKIAAIDRRYHLSAAQKERLTLAGQGDMRRLFDRLHVAREKFVATSQRGNENEIQAGRAEAAVLYWEFKRGAFGEGSLFAKAQNTVLLPEQLDTFERRCRQVAKSTQKITLDNACRLKAAALFRKDVRQISWTQRDDEIAIVGFWGHLEICSRNTLQVLRTLGKGHPLAGFDLRGDWCAVGPADALTLVYLINVSTGHEVTLKTDLREATVALSPDGKFLATGGRGIRALLWSAEKGKRLRKLGDVPEGLLTPVFSPDGSIVAVGNDSGSTFLFDVATGHLLRRLRWQSTHELKFDPSGKRLAAAYQDGNLAIWDVASGELLQRALGRVKEVHTLDWSPDGSILVSGGFAGSVTLWNSATLRSLIELDAPDLVHCVRFNPEGTRLYFAGGPAQPGGIRDLEVWAVPPEIPRGN